LTESGLAFPGENVGDGPSEMLLDHRVGVHEAELNLFCDEPADGGFARAHETDQRQIVDVALIIHYRPRLPGTRPDGTQILEDLMLRAEMSGRREERRLSIPARCGYWLARSH
jgi:hypothetical protein